MQADQLKATIIIYDFPQAMKKFTILKSKEILYKPSDVHIGTY